jgi:hypothetical protein
MYGALRDLEVVDRELAAKVNIFAARRRRVQHCGRGLVVHLCDVVTVRPVRLSVDR